MRGESIEEAPKDRFKVWLQNFLGGLVLLYLPAVPGVLFVGWNTVTDITHKQERLSGELSDLKQHLERDHAEFKKQLAELRMELSFRIGKLEDWKDVTNSNRFRASDGERLSVRIDRLESSQNEHYREAQKWISIIERNTPLIFENQRKSHTH